MAYNLYSGNLATAKKNRPFMQSILQILAITIKDGTSKKTNQPYSIKEAQCVLLNDDGTPALVGSLVIPKSMTETAKVGVFTASFGFVVGFMGDDKGRIVAQLAGLTPLPPNYLKQSTKSL
jgi:hypothetical protein